MRMSIAAAITATLMLVAGGQQAIAANAGSAKMKACGAQWSAMTPAQKTGMTYQQFTAKCMSAKTMAAPMLTPQQKLSACAANWQKAKAAHTTGGLTYQQFTAKCTKSS